MTRASLLCSVLLLASCAGDATEIIVVVDTDFAVPDALNEIEIQVDASAIGGQARDRTAELEGDAAIALPVSLGVVHQGGPLGPLRIAAVGRLGATEVVRREVEVSFVQGEIWILRLQLERACLGVTCGAEQTCAGGTCRSVVVSVGDPEFGRYDGQVGSSDAGFCEPSGEVCDDQDNDCDGLIDEIFSFEDDPNNCGSCGSVCPTTAANAEQGACVGGACELLCFDGFFDCDGDPANGCESQLVELDNCGECASTCSFDGATSTCGEGVCTLDSCDSGRFDCDGLPDNGCESARTELDNCGECGVRCELANANASCASGSCEIVGCALGFDDCDGSRVNGCEADVQTGLRNCGGCGLTCGDDPPNASASCTSGSCALSCDPGFEDCDGDAANGCERDLGDPASCGDCTTSCPPGMPRCSGNPVSGYACVVDCPSGETPCGTTCADLLTSTSNCGTCGTVCPAEPNTTAVCNAGVCETTCDPGFGDCTAAPGCETPLDTLGDCGSCGNACAATGATVVRCDVGACTIDGCASGLADCDGVFATGCESSLGSLTDCGACGVSCGRTNASPTCATGTCRIGSCNPSFASCDGIDSNGCEADLSQPSHCGTCMNNCPSRPNSTPICNSGSCGIRCTAPFADCDGDPLNGCEINTNTDDEHCAGCGNECARGPNVRGEGCAMAACVIEECEGPWADCNGVFSDGCEVDTDNDDNNCGICGRVCSCDGGSCG